MTPITITRKALVVAALTGTTLTGLAGVAAAGSASGGCAIQMVNPNAMPGMGTAMGANNEHGTAGMYRAIAQSC